MDDIINVLNALSDKTRIRILSILSDGELCVCKIVDVLGKNQPQISFHLNILKASDIIQGRKEGKWIHYKINDADLFKRFLVISTLEKVKEDDLIISDKKRLDSIKKGK